MIATNGEINSPNPETPKQEEPVQEEKKENNDNLKQEVSEQ